jgi:3-oxoacyl-[acyl-carrier-protein] synthase II
MPVTLSVRFAGEVRNFNVADYMPEKKPGTWTASSTSDWPRPTRRSRTPGLPTGDQLDPGTRTAHRREHRFRHRRPADDRGNAHRADEPRPRRISPFFVPASIINMISGHVSIRHGFQGANIAVVTACTTGLHAIGLSRA